MRLKFPLKILRLSLEMCCFVRHLVFNGCVHKEGVRTCTAIIAGLSYATDVLLLVVAPVLDEALERWPHLAITAQVDDIGLQITGQAHEVQTEIVAATTYVIQGLREQGCSVALGEAWGAGSKSMSISSTPALASALPAT